MFHEICWACLQTYTLPETYSLPLKIDAWKMTFSLGTFKCDLFSGVNSQLVSGSVFFYKSPKHTGMSMVLNNWVISPLYNDRL